jgi:hypothetical protein
MLNNAEKGTSEFDKPITRAELYLILRLLAQVIAFTTAATVVWGWKYGLVMLVFSILFSHRYAHGSRAVIWLLERAYIFFLDWSLHSMTKKVEEFERLVKEKEDLEEKQAEAHRQAMRERGFKA